MPTTPELIVVDPSGRSMIVDILDARDDVSVTCYTTLDGAVAHSLPVTISSATSFYLTAAGGYKVSAKVGGREIAGDNAALTVDVRHRVPVRVLPTLSLVETLAAVVVPASSTVTYDPTIAGLTATNVKAALDELTARIVVLETP